MIYLKYFQKINIKLNFKMYKKYSKILNKKEK